MEQMRIEERVTEINADVRKRLLTAVECLVFTAIT